MNLEFVDITGSAALVAAAIVPVVLIVFFRWTGFVFGVLSVWAILFADGALQNEADSLRVAIVLDSVRMVFGWAIGIVYCLPIIAVRELVRFRASRRTASVKAEIT